MTNLMMSSNISMKGREEAPHSPPTNERLCTQRRAGPISLMTQVGVPFLPRLSRKETVSRTEDVGRASSCGGLISWDSHHDTKCCAVGEY